MRRVFLALALVALMAMVSAPAGATSNGASGHMIIEGLTLAGTQYGTPSGLPTTEATDPLTIPVTAGDTFHYSTITCQSPFPPWNNVGLHFAPDYPGIEDPASVRHELEGRVTRLTANGHGTVEGTIRTYLCEQVPGSNPPQFVRGDQIVTSFRANFRPTSDTSVMLESSRIGRSNPVPTYGGLAFNGHFTVIDGTGRFADLSGNGAIMGQFTRLGTRPGTPESLNPPGYSEVPFQQKGGFRDPTVPAG